MSKLLIDKLSKLTLEEKSLQRTVNLSYNKDLRTKTLIRLKEVMKEKEKVKNLLKLEKEFKNENNNTI